jgi:hypothetical protein
MRIFIFFGVLFAATKVGACVSCGSATGAAVRAGILNDDFVRTLIEVAAPFPLIGLILYAVNRYLPE